jgi:hypothetical protein
MQQELQSLQKHKKTEEMKLKEEAKRQDLEKQKLENYISKLNDDLLELTRAHT